MNILIIDVEKVLFSCDEGNRTFLHKAARWRTPAVARLLLEADIPLDVKKRLIFVKDTDTQTVLHRAARNDRHKDMLLVLLEFISNMANYSLMGKLTLLVHFIAF